MHILFLTDNFPPEVNAPASRTFEHCREWVKSGHQVTVVTCAPNFPGGKVFHGYRNRLWQSANVDGIRVIRVWTYITANSGFARRILDYLSFMVSGFLAGLFVRRVDLVIGTSPQFFTVCAARVLGMCKRVPWVFELRDLWPESIKAVEAMRHPRLLRWLERLELYLYRKATRVVSVTHSFREVLVARGIPADKIAVVTNGVDLTRFRPAPKDPELTARLGLTDCLVFGYIGTHGLAHALETLLHAAVRWQQSPALSHLRLLLLGDGAQKASLQAEAQRLKLANVVFCDSVAKAEVVRYWSLLDVAIVHLKRTPVFETVIPSKIFEAMAMGIPLLHGVAGESAAIVQQEGCGLVFAPENVDALCAGAGELLDAGVRARLAAAGRAASARYERSHLAAAMLETLVGCVAATGRS